MKDHSTDWKKGYGAGYEHCRIDMRADNEKETEEAYDRGRLDGYQEGFWDGREDGLNA